MGILLIILGVLPLVAAYFSMKQEKKLSGFYKQTGVCGRWYAFFTADFLVGGALAVLAAVAVVVIGILDAAGATQLIPAEMGSPFGYGLGLAVCGGVMAALGILMYQRAAKKCPEKLRRRLLWDMIVMMVGVSFRIGLFFMMFLIATWWAFSKPEEYEMEDGRIVYIFPGSNDVYDGGGNLVGTADPNREKVTKRW